MKHNFFLVVTLLGSVIGWGAIASAEEPRWLADSCLPVLSADVPDGKPSPSTEERWNTEYRRGWKANEDGELDLAERSFCRALAIARAFPATDIRFAETLDELGLIYYNRGELAKSEAAQGAAAAELLLTLGPPVDDLTPAERQKISSSVASYLMRLGWIYAGLERASGEIEELEARPYFILGRGYLPNHIVARRLDWLISRYLLAEDMAAADWLTGLQNAIAAGLVESP